MTDNNNWGIRDAKIAVIYCSPINIVGKALNSCACVGLDPCRMERRISMLLTQKSKSFHAPMAHRAAPISVSIALGHRLRMQ